MSEHDRRQYDPQDLPGKPKKNGDKPDPKDKPAPGPGEGDGAKRG